MINSYANRELKITLYYISAIMDGWSTYDSVVDNGSVSPTMTIEHSTTIHAGMQC